MLFREFDGQFQYPLFLWRKQAEGCQLFVAIDPSKVCQLFSQCACESSGSTLKAFIPLERLIKEQRAQLHASRVRHGIRLRRLLFDVNWNRDIHSSSNFSAERVNC